MSPALTRMLERMNCSLTDAGPTYLMSTRSIFGPAACDHAALRAAEQQPDSEKAKK